MEKNIRTVRWITFLALLTTAVAFLYFLGDRKTDISLLGIVLVVATAVMLTWGLETWLRFLLGSLGKLPSVSETIRPSSENNATMELISASRDLVLARTRREVVEVVLKTGILILAADGASFVSFEEWGSPLAPISIGYVPIEKKGSWSEKLANPSTRQVCRTCSLREGEQNCVLIPSSHDRKTKVICLPLREDNREIGVVNYFHRSAATIEETSLKALGVFAEQASVALNGIRQREQEITADNLQKSSSARKNYNVFLSSLSVQIRQATHAEAVLFWIPSINGSGEDRFFASSDRDQEYVTAMNAESLWKLWGAAKNNSKPFYCDLPYSGDAAGVGKNLVVPFVGDGDELPGLMIIVAEESPLDEKLLPFLEIAARMASMLFLSSRFIEQMEFQAAIGERKRLAREIHDGLAQSLAFLKIQSAQMLSYLNLGKLDKLEAALSANYQTLAAAYQDARQAIDNLRSESEPDTQEWLVRIAQDFKISAGIDVDVSQLNIDIELPLAIQAQVIRVVQEALMNVRKHAQAKNVRLSGAVKHEEVVVEISDDGVGFEPDQSDMESKYGLIGMRERADMAGGEFQVISRQGEGTTVRLTIPCPTSSR